MEKPIQGRPHSPNLIKVDFRRIFSRFFSFWWLFLICVAGCVGAGKLFLRYADYQYASSASILIRDAGSSRDISARQILSSSEAFSGNSSIDNEIQILRSLSLMEKVVRRLRLNISYSRVGKLKETEIYEDSPFLLTSFTPKGELEYGETLLLQLEDWQSFHLKRTPEEEGRKIGFGEPFELSIGTLVVDIRPGQTIVKGLYKLQITSISNAARKYKGRLTIQRVGNFFTSSVLHLGMQDQVAKKTSDLINTLIEVYNEEEIRDENKVLESTLEFIDQRVKILVGELDTIERDIQRFKSNNQIINESAATSLSYTLGEIRNSLRDLSEYETQIAVMESIERILKDESGDFQLLPVNMDVNQSGVGNLVQEYNELVLEHREIVKTAAEQNPFRLRKEEKLQALKQLILKTIEDSRSRMSIPVAAAEENIEKLQQSMASIPGIDKQLLEKTRMQELKEQLFLYLLQKREETALSKAITTAKSRVIDEARPPRFPIYPKTKLILFICGLLGLVLPVFLILILDFFDTKVDSEETIKLYTQLPILGKIPHNKSKKNLVVRDGSRSEINEMFRTLRTNLNFVMQGKDKQTLLLTSSISKEGKTFISTNLGIVLSLTGKKVILLGLDLRQPKMGQYLGAPDGRGDHQFFNWTE